MASEYLELNPVNPEHRLVEQVSNALKMGCVVAYPTDSGYALGCQMGQEKAQKKIVEIRQLSKVHNFTLICQDLAQISEYAKVDNPDYRMLKRCTPGGYTFILNATRKVPKLMLKSSKTTIGIRVPDHEIAHALSKALGEPLMSTTLILPGQSEPLYDIEDVIDAVGDQVDIVVDGGYCGFESTSVIDLTQGIPVILREGSGDVSFIG